MTRSADAVIEVRLTGAFGGFRLDVAFETPVDGVTALVGPSGCGKTTLLRCIAGLERAKGEIQVAGEVWQDRRRFTPAYRRPVGYVFQEPSLLAHLSVRRNLTFGLSRAKTPPLTGFDEVVELLGVGTLLGRAPAHLSGGEQQRVAIGRALLSQPRLLLLDEPLSNLDAAGKAEILPYLDRLHRTLAVPVLYVSHDDAEIARLADRTLYMDGGRIVDAPSEVGMAPKAAAEVLSQLGDEQVRGLALAALIGGLRPRGD